MSDATLATPSLEHFARFSALLDSQGPRAALAYLLKLSDYRFIGIFRFQNARANAAIHFDRENPEVLSATEVPDTATYCCVVRNSKGVFPTANALLDSRCDTHPARQEVLAYCGVPIMDAEGEVLGTLCHYDLQPRDPSKLDLELLVRAAVVLQAGQHIPPYPQTASLN